jgi:hypothetical protein
MIVPIRGLQAIGCKELAASRAVRVVILDVALAEFESLEDAKKARLVRIMELWCDNHRLTPEQFNANEGREQKGNINIRIQAFKAYKVRLYGSVTHIDGCKTFVISTVDAAKKQDKADVRMLERAKKRASEVELALVGAGSRKR